LYNLYEGAGKMRHECVYMLERFGPLLP